MHDGAPQQTKIEVLLVDDHPAVRHGLALLLAPDGIHVCGEASGRGEALAELRTCRPDVALVDLSLGGEDGTAVVAELHALGISPLVYSMYEDARHIEGAFAAGALGYVTKREIHRVLVHAIREIAAGHRFVSPNAAIALAENAADAIARGPDRGLSEQEREVYRLLGIGEGTVEIAAALGISARTVESYFARIMDKLGVDGMHDLRRHAIAHFRDRAT